MTAWTDRWLALLAAGALLVWSLPIAVSPLAGALEPEVLGAGLALLLAIPALCLLLARGAAPRPAVLPQLLLFIGALAVSAWRRPPVDTLGADRVWCLLGAAVALLCVGAALAREGRQSFAVLALVATLALTAPSLYESRFTGALGNSGALAECAAIGAAVGAWYAIHARGPLVWFGAAALAAQAWLAGRTPVLAAAIALACLLVAAWMCAGPRRARALRVGLGALALFATAFFTRAAAPAPGPNARGAAVSSELGGAPVRLRIWSRLPIFVADHALLGVGPGQFRASFPPYRDPAEIELERRAFGEEIQTEVEHAHNDWLQGLCEAGVVGGGAWILFLALVAWSARRALVARDVELGPLALAALALCVHGALRAPLLWNPASASGFFVLAGALTARATPATTFTRAAARFAACATLVALLALAPTAWTLVRYGRALRFDGERAPDVAAALELRPDGVKAREFAARQLEAQGELQSARGEWQRVLDLQPFHVPAWMQQAWLALVSGEIERARAAWERVLELDPEQRKAAWNLVLLEAEFGDRVSFERALARHPAEVSASSAFEAWIAYAARGVLAGNARAGHALARGVVAAGVRWDPLDGEAITPPSERTLAQAGLSSECIESVARARELLEQLAFAREHARLADFAAAVRNYRQVERLSHVGVLRAALAYRVELAAALALAGDLESAGERLAPDELAQATSTNLEPWIQEGLARLGRAR